MTDLLASPYAAAFGGAFALAAVTAATTLGTAWDRITTRTRRYYAPGRHRR